ncbi:unannotated protein [freshwater metagenome]|uniref:Unannotated protein n=1 Tax=freshwater metagenome TaxID=449393 RepID=A0A6J6JSE8_9ZZZZ
MPKRLRIRVLVRVEIVVVGEDFFPVCNPSHSCSCAGSPLRNLGGLNEESGRERHDDETHHEGGHESTRSSRRIRADFEVSGSIPFVEGKRNDQKTRHDEEEVERKHSARDEIRGEVIHHRTEDDEESPHSIKSGHVIELLDGVDGRSVDGSIIDDRRSDSRSYGIGAGVIRLVSLFAGRHCHRLHNPLVLVLLDPHVILTQVLACSLSAERQWLRYWAGRPRRDRALSGSESRSQRAATCDPSMEKCTPSGRHATPSRV